MATLRQLRSRVTSIRSIQRVTNAMYMVAAAKLRRAQEALGAARPYARHLDGVLHDLTVGMEESEHPLLRQRPEVRRAAMVVITADRGLCGGFNGAIGRRALAQIVQNPDVQHQVITVGRKGRDLLRQRGHEAARHHADVFGHLRFARAVEIGGSLTARFARGEVDRVLLVFSEFRSVVQQVPVVEQLLPVAGARSDGGRADLICEPEPEALLEALVPRRVTFQIWRALLESNAGEQAARMQAMDSATKNAGDLIKQLTREMNKQRQTSITLELMDIVGGAEAVAH
ncbi:MAG: ATP synthase F1 subunit gamma [Candidatus Latescibacterota bacterium]